MFQRLLSRNLTGSWKGLNRKKEMYEQLDIFSFPELQDKLIEQNFFWDSDINEIHNRLSKIALKYHIQTGKAEFSIWPHVPQYGYRLWLNMKVTREILKNENFQNEIEEIVKFAETRKIELSVMWGACFFFANEDTANLNISTCFMDKKRRKRK